MVTEQSHVLNCRMFCILISKVISRLCVLFIRPLVVCLQRLSFLCRLRHLVQAWYGLNFPVVFGVDRSVSLLILNS